jgi:putative membrane protein
MQDDPPRSEERDGEPQAIPSTRAARTWARILPALVLLALTVVFVVQNPRESQVRFLTFSGHLPLAVALLAAAALGALVVLALGSIRILQLRSLVRRRTVQRDRGDADPPAA